MSKPSRNKALPTRNVRHAGAPGFAVKVDALRGLLPADCRRIERALEEHAEAHGLSLHGRELQQFVTADEHELSANDQVALINRLVDLPEVVAVHIGPIVDSADGATVGVIDALTDETNVKAWTVVRTGDPALIGLTLLYRCGRVSADLYLQILGGFFKPAGMH